ncbi:MAG: hypothetical protein ABIH23_32700 [bacterium]
MRSDNGQSLNKNKKMINPFASSSEEGGLQKSTFARYGKLSLKSTPPCTRCEATFNPKSEILRLHNRGELTSLLCPNCTERDNQLLCACVKLIVIKGGFPPTVEQLAEAFYERDEGLNKSATDPFETLRKTYEEDPLTEEDILYWVHADYFSMNPVSKQLDCMIDRIMSSAERTLLLGKEGLSGKDMAAKRQQRLQMEKQEDQRQGDRRQGDRRQFDRGLGDRRETDRRS